MSASLLHFINKGLVKRQVFNSNGTFTVPKGVEYVYVEGCGGGGGGAFGVDFPGCGAGSALWVDVVPESNVSVVIGAGGAAAGAVGADGGDGGDSSFGSVVFYGAAGGKPVGGTPRSGGNYLPTGQTTTANYGPGTRPGLGSGGNIGSIGGGAAGQFGNGGNFPGGSAGANTGAGGAAGENITPTNPGNGGSGRVVVYWVEPE